MEIKIEKDVANKLLNRRELTLGITYDGATPSRDEIKAEASKKYDLSRENVVVVSVDQLYGAGSSRVELHEYADQAAKSVAQKYMVERPNKKKEKAGEKQEKAAAKPAEEKK